VSGNPVQVAGFSRLSGEFGAIRGKLATLTRTQADANTSNSPVSLLARRPPEPLGGLSVPFDPTALGEHQSVSGPVHPVQANESHACGVELGRALRIPRLRSVDR
jgi:hypothetical protein